MQTDDAVPWDALSVSGSLQSTTSAGRSAGTASRLQKTGSGQTCSCSAALGGGAEVPSVSPTALPSRNDMSMSLHQTHCPPVALLLVKLCSAACHIRLQRTRAQCI